MWMRQGIRALFLADWATFSFIKSAHIPWENLNRLLMPPVATEETPLCSRWGCRRWPWRNETCIPGRCQLGPPELYILADVYSFLGYNFSCNIFDLGENHEIPNTLCCHCENPAVLFLSWLFWGSSNTPRKPVGGPAHIMDFLPCPLWSLPIMVHCQSWDVWEWEHGSFSVSHIGLKLPYGTRQLN